VDLENPLSLETFIVAGSGNITKSGNSLKLVCQKMELGFFAAFSEASFFLIYVGANSLVGVSSRLRNVGASANIAPTVGAKFSVGANFT
jgi:hypothetical protein